MQRRRRADSRQVNAAYPRSKGFRVVKLNSVLFGLIISCVAAALSTDVLAADAARTVVRTRDVVNILMEAIDRKNMGDIAGAVALARNAATVPRATAEEVALLQKLVVSWCTEAKDERAATECSATKTSPR